MKYLPLLLLSGCLDIDPWRAEWPENNGRTPDGYRRWFPEEMSVDPGLVQAWIDVRVADWIALRSDTYGAENVSNLAITTTFWVMDDYRFQTQSGYVVGDITVSSNHPVARVCIYDHEFGHLPDDGMGLIVIEHELDHRLGISH